jgi:hypothetical protein
MTTWVHDDLSSYAHACVMLCSILICIHLGMVAAPVWVSYPVVLYTTNQNHVPYGTALTITRRRPRLDGGWQCYQGAEVGEK